MDVSEKDPKEVKAEAQAAVGAVLMFIFFFLLGVFGFLSVIAFLVFKGVSWLL